MGVTRRLLRGRSPGLPTESAVLPQAYIKIKMTDKFAVGIAYSAVIGFKVMIASYAFSDIPSRLRVGQSNAGVTLVANR